MLEACRSAGQYGKPNGSTGMGVGVAAYERDRHNQVVRGGLLTIRTLLTAADTNSCKAAHNHPLHDAICRHIDRMVVQATTLIDEYCCLAGDSKLVKDGFKFVEPSRMRYTVEAAEELKALVHETATSFTADVLFAKYSEFASVMRGRFVDGDSYLAAELAQGGNVVLEGAQGALLDRCAFFVWLRTRNYGTAFQTKSTVVAELFDATAVSFVLL
eukprot:SAG31_NODE_3338_length_4388_cov_1.970856_3_plen_215_part_00